MRRRLTFASALVAILLIFVLPASTVSASTYYYTVKTNTCKASGGYYGYGHLAYKVQIKEYGKSGANRFSFAAIVQYQSLSGGKWRTAWNAGVKNYYFPNNSASYAYWYSWWYDPAIIAWHRFKVTLKVYSGSFVLATKTLYGKTC